MVYCGLKYYILYDKIRPTAAKAIFAQVLLHTTPLAQIKQGIAKKAVK
jgi:hypothetical protein